MLTPYLLSTFIDLLVMICPLTVKTSNNPVVAVVVAVAVAVLYP